MKIRLSLISLLVIVSFFTYEETVFAIPSPNIVIEDDVFGYHFILRNEEDFLLIIRFDLVSDGVLGDGDWDDFTSIDAIVRLEDNLGNLLAGTHTLRVGQGFVGFYFDAGEAPFSFDDELFIEIVGNPGTFTSGSSSSALEWKDGSSILETREVLEDDLILMVSDMESEFNDYTPGDLIETNLINLTGRDLVREAFPLIDVVAPNAFTVSQTVNNLEGFDPPTDKLQAANAASPLIDDALQVLSDTWGIAKSWIGFGIALIFSFLLALVSGKAADRMNYGLIAAIGSLTFWGMMGIVSTTFVLLMGGMFFIVAAMWLTSKIPQ